MAGNACPMCLTEVVPGQEALETLGCGHTFHPECIQRDMSNKGIANVNAWQCITCQRQEAADNSAEEDEAAVEADSPHGSLHVPGEAEAPGEEPEPAAEATEDPPGSPLPTTQGGSSVPVQHIPGFGVSFPDRTRAAGEANLADPLHGWQNELAQVSTDNELTMVLHDAGLFAGLRTEEETYATVTAWLKEIGTDIRTHREIAVDPTLDGVRLHMPKPFVSSIQAVARHEGWRAETLMAPVWSNIGWCERPGLKLFLREGEQHGRAPVVQIFVAGDPTMRKSSLKTFTSQELLSGERVDEVVRAGESVSTEATVKGIRASITNHQRAGIVSDEVTTSYAHSVASSSGGLHVANKDKLCTWLNAERDVVATGQGRLVLESYAFVHQVYGQLEKVEIVLKPEGQGFVKRFHAVWQVQPAEWSPGQDVTRSRPFLK